MSNSSSKRTPAGTPPPPTPTIRTHNAALTLNHIESNMIKILQSAKTFEQEHPDKRDALASVFHRLFKGLDEHWPHLLPPTPPPEPKETATELNSVKETLSAIQRTIVSMQSQLAALTPDTTITHQLAPQTTAATTFPSNNSSNHLTTPNTYANTLNTPPRPSIPSTLQLETSPTGPPLTPCVSP
jgi:hypothetical protein